MWACRMQLQATRVDRVQHAAGISGASTANRSRSLAATVLCRSVAPTKLRPPSRTTRQAPPQHQPIATHPAATDVPPPPPSQPPPPAVEHQAAAAPAAPQDLSQMLARLAHAFDGVQTSLNQANETSAAAEDAMNRAAAAFKPVDAAQEPPALSKPWKVMNGEERREYLAAVRDHYGEGILYERVLRGGGRSVLALLDPRMQQQAEAHAWTAAATGAGSLYTRGMRNGRRTQLAVWTAEECLLGGARLPSACALVAFRDGCPANTLARNLELVAKPGRLHSFQLFMSGLVVAPGQAPLLLAAGAGSQADQATEEMGASALDPSSAALRAAEASAKLAVEQMYGVAGAERGRAYLASLHEEYLAAWQLEFPSRNTDQL